MLGSLFTGVTGLRNHQTRMDVIGNNIANINTIGFKSGRVNFSEVWAQTLQSATAPGVNTGGTNPMQIGLGMGVSSIDQSFAQGAIQSTGITTDLAIQGDGFFVLSDGNDQFYTRTSAFQLDAQGRFVDPASGMIVQGLMADGNGQFSSSSLGDITLPFGEPMPAKATTSISWTGNLDASASPTETILDGGRIFALASSTDSVFGLHDSNGIALGLGSGDEITLSANATGSSGVHELVDSSGTSLGLALGNSMVISGLATAIESATLTVDDFGAAFSFDIQVTDEAAGTATETHTVSVPDLSDVEDTEEAIDLIIQAIRDSGIDATVANDGDGTFSITGFNQSTRITLDASAELASIGLVPGDDAIPAWDRITLGTNAGEAETVDQLLAAIESSLQTTSGLANLAVEFDPTTGTFKVTNDDSASVHVEIRTDDTNSVFAATVAALQGEVEAGDETDDSGQLRFEDTIFAGSDFVDLDGLATALGTSLSEVSGDLTVSVGSDGRLLYENGAAGNDIYGLEVDTVPTNRSVFRAALGLDGQDLATGSDLQSDRLLDTADGDDAVDALYASTGEHLGLDLGDTIQLDATMGGQEMTTVDLLLGVDATTYGELADAIGSSLGIENIDAVTIDGDGSLRIAGDPGLANEIADLSLSEDGNSVLDSAMAMDSVQEATDVTETASALVYDSQGNAHTIVLEFTKTNLDNVWNWNASMADGGTVTAGGTGRVTFDEDGGLASFVSDDGSDLVVEPETGANTVSIEMNPGTMGSLDGLTQFASASSVLASEQDGYGTGELASIFIDGEGVISGTYTNAVSRDLAKIQLAAFNNAAGLERAGSNLYSTSANSGVAIVGSAGTEFNSQVVSGGLEQSNVDLAEQFSDLILTQRGFQASTRIITTSDELLIETVNLKR